jgi:hypothetical protein
MANACCAKCKFRGIYERKPKSLLGRLWRWHANWCPGWKAYLRSLSEEERNQVLADLDNHQEKPDAR